MRNAILGATQKGKFSPLLALPMIAFLGSPAHANLVLNGDFSLGPTNQAFDDWSLIGNSGGGYTGTYTGTFTGTDFSSASTIPPNPGQTAAYLGPLSDGFMYQIIPLTAGGTYTLSFELQNLGGTPNDFDAMLDGRSVAANFNNSPTAPIGWTYFSYTFVATGSFEQLSFYFEQQPSWWLLTDVSILPGTSGAEPTPLPAALPLFATGLSALGLIGWRRRRKNRARH
jgi:hypothetical protein